MTMLMLVALTASAMAQTKAPSPPEQDIGYQQAATLSPDGMTAVACIKERRHFIGFELSKEYFDKAVKRIKAEQAQLTLF